jgi:hypothetical protein
VIIFEGKELTYEQQMGYDIWAGFNSDSSIRDNSGPGVPPLIACSPKGLITSKILREAFQRLDALGIYERLPGGPIPLVLFDAHNSRLQVCE